NEHIKGLRNIDVLKKKGLSLMAIKEKINADAPGVSHKKEKPTDIVYNSKRDEIVKVSVNLFRKKGYDATSIDEIIKKQVLEREHFISILKTRNYFSSNVLITYFTTLVWKFLKFVKKKMLCSAFGNGRTFLYVLTNT